MFRSSFITSQLRHQHDGSFSPAIRFKVCTAREGGSGAFVVKTRTVFLGVWCLHPEERAVLAAELETRSSSGKMVSTGCVTVALDILQTPLALQLHREKGGSELLLNRSFASHQRSGVL